MNVFLPLILRIQGQVQPIHFYAVMRVNSSVVLLGTTLIRTSSLVESPHSLFSFLSVVLRVKLIKTENIRIRFVEFSR